MTSQSVRNILRVSYNSQKSPGRHSVLHCGKLCASSQPRRSSTWAGASPIPALDYISQKLLRLQSTSGANPATLFYFSGNLWLPEIGPALGGSLSPGCGDCIWISSLLAAIPRGEKCGLAQAVQKIRGSGDILSERIWLRTTFPRHPGGYRADPSLACGTLGLRGRGSEGEQPRSWGLDQVPEVHPWGSEGTVQAGPESRSCMI